MRTETFSVSGHLPSIERLNELFSVRDDGALIRKVSIRGSRYPKGSVAGSLHPNGYVAVAVDYHRFQAHRVVFAITHGRWPTRLVDHVNGVKSDNRPSNLREATGAENQHNTKVHRTNKSGFRAVSWSRDRNKWQVKLNVAGKRIFCGRFDSLSEAARVAEQMIRKYHGEFSRAA